MSLAQILYPPPVDKGMEEWFHAHAQHHLAIIAAYKAKGVILADLGLYPVPKQDLEDWLQRHQTMHTQMSGAAGVAGTDLTGLDLNNKQNADAWYFQHFLQHQGVAQASGAPI